MSQKERQIVIEGGGLSIKAHLLDTMTARSIWSGLPIVAPAERWGGLVELRTTLAVPLESTARQVVDVGDACFWCEGRCLIFAFGPTPIALDGECRLVAPVNVWGRMEGDLSALEGVSVGDKLSVQRWAS